MQKGTEEKNQVKQGNTQENAQLFADCRLARFARGVEQGQAFARHHLEYQASKKRLAEKNIEKKDEAKHKSKAKKQKQIAKSTKAKRKIQTETKRGTNGKERKIRKSEEEWTKRDKHWRGGKDNTKGRHLSIQTRKVSNVAPC